MPVKVSVDCDERLAKRTYSGVVTGHDLLDSIREYAVTPGFDPSFNEISDFREVTNIDAMIEDIHRCAHTPDPFLHETKRVIVAPQALIYGLARMYQMMGEEMHPNLYVVRTIEEAQRILGTPTQSNGTDSRLAG